MINLLTSFADSTCTFSGGAFLTLPHWYQYLSGTMVNNVCSPQSQGINDIWLIVLAVTEMLLQLVALIAIIMVIYGGVQMLTSQGQPDGIAKARTTIINALIGMTISIAAAAIITFLAGNIGG